MEVLEGQVSVLDMLKKKILKRTNEYEVIKYGQVYRIHFYDKKDREKCRVTKNLEYVKRYL